MEKRDHLNLLASAQRIDEIAEEIYILHPAVRNYGIALFRESLKLRILAAAQPITDNNG